MRKHIALCLKILAASYPTWSAKATRETAEVWELQLADLPPEDVVRACMVFTRKVKYPPSIAEIRALAEGGPDPIVQAVEAWNRVYGHVQRHGLYSGVRINWTDPVAEEACKAIGGVRALREAKSDQVGFLRAQFCKVYERRLAEGRAEEARVGVERLLRAGGSDNGTERLLR